MTTNYYFLREDLEQLDAKIAEIAARMREIGAEMGASCQEGAETFHDNFAYEDGERQQVMLSRRLRDLLQIRNNARVVDQPTRPQMRVCVGRRVTVVDDETGELRTFQIGSYMTFSRNDAISYNAPIVRPLIGAEVGEQRECMLQGRRRSFEVLEIA